MTRRVVDIVDEGEVLGVVGGLLASVPLPAAAPVSSVNTQTGAVVLDADDIDDTSTTNKFATAAELTKLAGIEAGATTDQTAAEIVGQFTGTPDGSKFLRDDGTLATPAGGGGGTTFKRTVLSGGGNKSTSSTTKTPIDSTNLGYLTFSLSIGDVVRCTLAGQIYTSTTNAAYVDFEVDRPTSANIYIGDGNDAGVAAVGGALRTPLCAVGLFTATEAGVHGFRPVWAVSANSVTLANATTGADDSQISFIVEKLGAPAS